MNETIDSHTYRGKDSEGFYSRWSKRKLQAGTNQPVASTDINSPVDEPVSPEPAEEKVLLCDKDMPELDTLNEDSDYSCFLSPGVSEKLRKLALRQLFGGKSFNLCDGLDDYDEEFTSFEKLGDIVTADMRFQLEQEASRKLQIAVENEDDIANDIPDDSDELSMLDDNSLERDDYSPERDDSSPERDDSSPERNNNSPEQNVTSFEKATKNTAVESMVDPLMDETADINNDNRNSIEDNKLRTNENLS